MTVAAATDASRPRVSRGPDDDALLARWRAVRERVARAAEVAGRDPGEVTLVAVSKTVGAAAVAAVAAAGQRDFGESRAQELAAKRAATAPPGAAVAPPGGATAPPEVRWHFVGRLQRNKVRDVVGAVDLVHAVDRLALAEALAARARALGVVQRVLVQVNAGEDPAKAGPRPGEAAGLVAAVAGLPGLACEGLMTIPPQGVDPAPVFARLRALRDDLVERLPAVRHLSMGMSGDFEVAIAHGATLVRVGEAVFGPRPAPTGEAA